MIYEIKDGEKLIGITRFEFGDPPMGFVHGQLIPSDSYRAECKYENLKVIIKDTNQKLDCESIVIESYLEEIEVTALLSSWEEYERYFIHHLETYEASFK